VFSDIPDYYLVIRITAECWTLITKAQASHSPNCNIIFGVARLTENEKRLAPPRKGGKGRGANQSLKTEQ